MELKRRAKVINLAAYDAKKETFNDLETLTNRIKNVHDLIENIEPGVSKTILRDLEAGKITAAKANTMYCNLVTALTKMETLRLTLRTKLGQLPESVPVNNEQKQSDRQIEMRRTAERLCKKIAIMKLEDERGQG